MTEAPIEAAPEPVMKTAREPPGAPAHFSMSLSFSSIAAENSAVLKYGTFSPPIVRTASQLWTGPTVKFSITFKKLPHEV